MFDILNRLRSEHRPFARRLFDRLLEPWLKQLNESIPVSSVSKWKKTSQLQGIILLLNTAIDLNDQDDLVDTSNRLLSILALEPMPRFRFLLEWAIFSLSLRLRSSEFCQYAEYILDHLDNDDQTNPKFTASLIRIATLISTHSTATETYANRLLIRLAVLSTSSRVTIRHEAQWHFPIVWKHYLAHLCSGCALNLCLEELFKSIQKHEKYIEPPRDRILSAFDPETDRTLAMLFQGGYLAVDPPEEPLCTIDDFKNIWADENRWPDIRTKLLLNIPVGAVNIQLANLINESKIKSENGTTKANHGQQLSTASTPLQTKSQSLRLPSLSSAFIPQPSTSHRHDNNTNSPQLIIIASLISSTFNLGGICRAAECFGASELHIHSLSVVADKSFRSLSVTSEQHITIRETPASSLTKFLREKQTQGFSVVVVEQTDTSIMIPGWDRSKEEERTFLPKRSIVVMGAETTGVPATILGVADRCLEIGQWGVTRSLNVQTAAAIVCYEWRRVWGGEQER
jgi:tRNA guanosine-2'-O-methyltransferase